MAQIPVYLDYNATTPVDKKVLDAMLPFFNTNFGNAASSTHVEGWKAKAAVDIARNQVAQLISANPEELIFTSGATESCNLAIQGLFEKYGAIKNEIIVPSTEHPAVLDTCKALKRKGAEIVILNTNRSGRLDPDDLKKKVTEKTLLVCAMLVNNETGVIQPIKELVELAHLHNAFFFCDATQATGKIHVDVNDLGVDMLCLSAHKMYGPKGTGGLFVGRKSPRMQLSPIIFGGGHESALRSGTLNVPGIVGFGKSCEIASQEMMSLAADVSVLRTSFEQQILDLGSVYINGSTKHRVGNTSSLCFEGRKAADIISKTQGRLCVSVGSACSSASAQPSHVLLAMGFSKAEAEATIRFSFGKYNTKEEVARAVELIRLAI